MRSIYEEANSEFEGKIPDSDVFALENMTANMISMASIALLCVILLLIVESDIFKCCSRLSFFRLPTARTDI